MSQQVASESGQSCSVCMDDFPADGKRHMIEDDPVCGGCIDAMLPMFEEALSHEHHYPPKFGPVALAIDDFAYKFDSDFVKRYRRRELEYKTPFADRIYCSHQIRAASAPTKGSIAPQGARLALQQHEVDGLQTFGAGITECAGFVSGRKQRKGTKLLCSRCGGDVCGHCRKPLQTPTEKHDCTPPPKAAIDLEKEGQKRGIDFQVCPGDGIPIVLRDGCNAMRCTYCGVEFCFLCGVRASHDSGHWKAGSSDCPRFGRPGQNPLFDRVAPAEVPIADRLRANEIAVQMLLEFGDHLAANFRGDEDLAREAIQGIREAHGELMWGLILDEFLIIEAEMQAQEFNERLLNEVQAFAAALREEAEDAEQQAQAGAEYQAARPQAAARADLLQVEGLPHLLEDQLRALAEENLAFNAAFAPVNNQARAFVENHIRVVRVIEAIGANNLHRRLPNLQRGWHMYLARVPPQLAAAMIRNGLVPPLGPR